MKPQLILFNVASIVGFLVWLGWHYLKALGRAFSNANPSRGAGDIGWVFVVVGIAGAGGSAASWFVPADAARIVASAPLGLLLLGQVFIAWRENTRRNRPPKKEPGDREAQQRKLIGVSRDFILKDEFPDSPEGRNFAFLTLDREFNTLVNVTDAYAFKLHSHVLGKIDGNNLDTFEPEDELKYRYGRYLDSEGKTIFDRYTIRHRPDQALKRMWLKKYKV